LSNPKNSVKPLATLACVAAVSAAGAPNPTIGDLPSQQARYCPKAGRRPRRFLQSLRLAGQLQQ
jgi:hypothetical protein